MCDHCGCRELTPVARLMDEHDRLRELSEHIRRHLAAGDDAAAGDHFAERLVVLSPHVATEEGSAFPMLRKSEELVARELADAEGAEARRAGVLRVLHDLAEHMYMDDSACSRPPS
ncbi:hemerythrin domain-containing protein [Blastococcus saxobsidens]|nr:hemerythrin domain-containing protein [Blastococcus saxobsidens]